MPKRPTSEQRLSQVIPFSGGKIRTSKSKVPHIVTQRNGIAISICWFQRNQHYRVFSPYNVGSEQTRTDFSTLEELKAWLKEDSANQTGSCRSAEDD